MTVQQSTALRNSQLDSWQYGAVTGQQQSGVTLHVWAQSTAYTAFADWIVANGNVYVCRTSGTSSGSGGGPSTAALDITDGTAHWMFVGSSGIGPSAVLRIYAGSVPASAAASESGTLLVEFDLGVNWAGLAASGVKTLSSMPIAATAAAGGTGTTATHYRIYNSTGATCAEQGTVSLVGGGGDATLDNTLITTGQNVNLTGFSITQPGA